jgi:hypothetical protein
VDFLASAAIPRWKSFRHGCDVFETVNFSTVSKKAKSVSLKPLLSVDSATITFGKKLLKNTMLMN